MSNYNSMEMMICVASRLLQEGSTVSVGTGAPCAAAMLAQKTHAPDLFIFFEAGGVAPQLAVMPISVGESRTYYRGIMAASMSETMEACHRGLVDYTFLGGAQIDTYGNLNSTLIGDYYNPKVRLPGSGGANDFASYCWRIMVMTNHSPQRFVEKLDFVTTPGYLTGPGAREKAGLPANTGPYKVITDLGVMGYDEKTKRMRVESIHPGVTFEMIQENTGFEMLKADRIEETEAPSETELRILREEVDSQGILLNR
jgi:glutaconate CoA-transferase subunit B